MADLIIRMYEDENLTFNEIAEALGQDAGYVAKVYFVAKKSQANMKPDVGMKGGTHE